MKPLGALSVGLVSAPGVLFAKPAAADTFPVGSLILPSDENHQDHGVFEVYGLLNELLRAGVEVHWLILPGMNKGDIDFSAGATL